VNQLFVEKFSLIAELVEAKSWLQIQADLGLAENTIAAYGRALEDYLGFCKRSGLTPKEVTREQIVAYIHDLRTRPGKKGAKVKRIDSGAGLSNATMQQRLTAVRLFYDYLIEEGVREINPVGRGRYTPGKAFGGKKEHGLIPTYRRLPWIPTDEEWKAILSTALGEPLRNRMMLAMAYDAALRREELCGLETGDVDPSARLLRIRPENTKGRSERIVPYSEPTGTLFSAYLKHRRQMSRERGALFISESKRNKAEPITIWTWSKVIKGIADRSGVRRFTTHTLRHLRLTDLARAGWGIHEIAQFAGHRSLQTTLLYIHLSGRDLAEKLERTMAQLKAERVQPPTELFRE
jgi:site-specific recombinase XerD